MGMKRKREEFEPQESRQGAYLLREIASTEVYSKLYSHLLWASEHRGQCFFIHWQCLGRHLSVGCQSGYSTVTYRERDRRFSGGRPSTEPSVYRLGAVVKDVIIESTEKYAPSDRYRIEDAYKDILCKLTAPYHRLEHATRKLQASKELSSIFLSLSKGAVDDYAINRFLTQYEVGNQDEWLATLFKFITIFIIEIVRNNQVKAFFIDTMTKEFITGHSLMNSDNFLKHCVWAQKQGTSLGQKERYNTEKENKEILPKTNEKVPQQGSVSEEIKPVSLVDLLGPGIFKKYRYDVEGENPNQPRGGKISSRRVRRKIRESSLDGPEIRRPGRQSLGRVVKQQELPLLRASTAL